jgi:hypothetical protein
MGGKETLNQHWTGLSLHSHPGFAVQRSEGKACGKERISGGFVYLFRAVGIAILDLEEEHLLGVFSTFPGDACRGDPCVPGNLYGKIANYHRVLVPPW